MKVRSTYTVHGIKHGKTEKWTVKEPLRGEVTYAYKKQSWWLNFKKHGMFEWNLVLTANNGHRSFIPYFNNTEYEWILLMVVGAVLFGYFLKIIFFLSMSINSRSNVLK